MPHHDSQYTWLGGDIPYFITIYINTMKVTVNNTYEQQEKPFPKLMIDKNGTIVLVKEQINEQKYAVVYLSGLHIGLYSDKFSLYSECNPYKDFNGSITLSND